MLFCLLGLELHLVQHSFKELPFESSLAQVLKSLLYLILNFDHIRLGDSLNAYGESRLSGSMIKSITRTIVRCQARLDKSLIKCRIRTFKEQRLQNLQLERLVRILTHLIADIRHTELRLIRHLTHQVRHELDLSG